MTTGLVAVVAAAVVAATGAAVGAASWVVVRAAPDEWLLHVRGGRLVAGGVGLTVLRRPGDQVVRFTSTVQRVRFEAVVTDADLLPVRIEAFALWGVDPEDPLAAFRRLGLGGREGQTHLLAKPQYHAFQQAFAALMLRHAGRFHLADLVRDPTPLLAAMRGELEAQVRSLGGRLLDLQPLAVHAASEAVGAELAAPREEAARREAERARSETQRERDRLAAEGARAKAAAELATELQLEEERERVSAARRAAASRELDAELDAIRRRAEEQARKIRTLTAAEAEKPAAVREAELHRLRIESMAASIGKLPIKEARWFSLDSPLETVKRLLAAEA